MYDIINISNFNTVIEHSKSSVPEMDPVSYVRMQQQAGREVGKDIVMVPQLLTILGVGGDQAISLFPRLY